MAKPIIVNEEEEKYRNELGDAKQVLTNVYDRYCMGLNISKSTNATDTSSNMNRTLFMKVMTDYQLYPFQLNARDLDLAFWQAKKQCSTL